MGRVGLGPPSVSSRSDAHHNEVQQPFMKTCDGAMGQSCDVFAPLCDGRSSRPLRFNPAMECDGSAPLRHLRATLRCRDVICVYPCDLWASAAMVRCLCASASLRLCVEIRYPSTRLRPSRANAIPPSIPSALRYISAARSTFPALSRLTPILAQSMADPGSTATALSKLATASS